MLRPQLCGRRVGRSVRYRARSAIRSVCSSRANRSTLGAKGHRATRRRDRRVASDGIVAAYDFASRYPTNFSPTLALLLTGPISPVPDVRPIPAIAPRPGHPTITKISG